MIFEDISFEIAAHQTLLVSGRNGSGKSTLVKIISNVLSATSGTLAFSVEDRTVEQHQNMFVGLVSPYLQMYDEFTARENLRFALAIRGLNADEPYIASLLTRMYLSGREDDLVRTYSSGMKQRVKYAFALVHKPPILILDEPMANLDGEGTAIVHEIMAEHRRNGILVVATNDLSDVDAFDHRVDLNAKQ